MSNLSDFIEFTSLFFPILFFEKELNQPVKELQSQLKQLRLAETAEELPNLIREAEQVSWTYLELLEAITHFELNKREEKSLERRMEWAKFPYHKSLMEFK
ncbi:ATP-binding protein [Niallia taxi]|nr:ATP-binding protein [Niallia taxi]MDE5052485.1 ATP-binding protein [Niallia taxi]